MIEQGFLEIFPALCIKSQNRCTFYNFPFFKIFKGKKTPRPFFGVLLIAITFCINVSYQHMGVLGKYKNHIFDSETSYGISGIKNIRQKNPREIIVFATGCFDIAHSGHPLFIEQMRREGEKLAMKNQSVLVVIGLGKDSVIKKLKGNKDR